MPMTRCASTSPAGVRETTPGTGCWPPAGPVAPLLRGNRRGDLVGEHDFPSCQ